MLQVNEIILIVDDNQSVRTVMRRVLEPAGYGVYLAETARAALHIANSLGPELDILICDFILPDSPALEIVRAIESACPQVKTVVMSGSFTQGDVQPFQSGGGSYPVLSKPFTPQQLLIAIANVSHPEGEYEDR